MAKVEELWSIAHRLYARARASLDPSMKRKLMTVADNYLRQAEAIRRDRMIIQAIFPEPDSHTNETEIPRRRQVPGR